MNVPFLLLLSLSTGLTAAEPPPLPQPDWLALPYERLEIDFTKAKADRPKAGRLPLLVLHVRGGTTITGAFAVHDRTKGGQVGTYLETTSASIEGGSQKPADSRIPRMHTSLIPTFPGDGLDINDGLARVDGELQTYRRLVVRFLEGYRHMGEQIESALSTNDAKGARRLAHTLKGVSGNIGAKALFRASDALDTLLKATPLDGLLTAHRRGT